MESMQDTSYTIKTMNRKQVDIAIEWAATEGWNPGLHDADCYFTADPEGFLIGLVKNEPVATISVIKYGRSFGFLGFYIVKPGFRGNGYGIRIWTAGLEYLEGRDIGLDGVVAQQDNYIKSGFKLAFRNIRYQGKGGCPPPDADIVALCSLPFDTVAAFDRPFFPENRSEFLKAWISQPDSHSLGIMKNGRLSGYGVIRKCRTGYKTGPLFADTPELAESLFSALASKVPYRAPVFLDVPEGNPAATALAGRHHMNVSFETARMYAGKQPDIPTDRIFGVTSFEIG